MAADQRRRRLNSSLFVGCTSREQNRAKKKKLGLPQDDLNMRSNIFLEWDDKNKSVVAKREQISISRRDFVPFIDAVPHCYCSLADIVNVPREIFEFENLADILSYEVWQTHISETERNILTQFLPRGAEPDKVVQGLLSGDNFHFGNPFVKWGASLCSGKLHPDDVIYSEQCIKANKNTYSSELQKYHNDMIEHLRTWKDRWDGCKDPEEEILQKIWRSRKQAGKSIQLSDAKYHDFEENNSATPESCSWATSENACSNDNNAELLGDPQGRKGFSDSNVDNSSDGLKMVAKPKKGERLHKRNIQHGDGARYMSYVKVSKEQHQRVKRTMKHTSNSIQPRSLNTVLGNLDTLHVQPFEVFEEEERQKMNDYWLQLVNNNIPSGYANWIKKKLKVQQLAKSLSEELEEKLKFQEELSKQDDEEDSCHELPPELTDNAEATVSPNASAQEDREVSHALLKDEMANQVTKHEVAIALEDEEEKEIDNGLQGHTCNGTENIEEDDESVSLSAEEDHQEKIASISSRQQVTNMTVDSHDNNVIAKADDIPLVSEYPANVNHIDIPVSQGDPRDSTDDVWSAVSVPGSFYHSSSLGHQYGSSSELSLAHPQVMEDQSAQMLDLEAVAQENNSGRELLLRHSNDMSFCSSFPNKERSVLQEKNDGKQMLHRQPDDASFFSAYPTQDRNELFESFFKGHGGGLPYREEQKRMGLDFHQTDNHLMMENDQFSAHFRDQVDLSLPMEMRQKRMNDLYVDRNIQDSVYSDSGGRYAIPKHLPVNVQDWGVSTAGGMLSPSQSHMSGGDLVSQNWFPRENGARGGWSSLESTVVLNRSIGSQSNSDQSLFSVLSECNEMRSGSPYDSMGSSERFMQYGTYSAFGGGIIPSTSNILQQTTDPLNYFSRHEASAVRKTNNLGWMSVSHQSSGLQEPMSKPFVRSWNQ